MDKFGHLVSFSVAENHHNVRCEIAIYRVNVRDSEVGSVFVTYKLRFLDFLGETITIETIEKCYYLLFMYWTPISHGGLVILWKSIR